MIKTPIVIAATAAAGLAQPGLGSRTGARRQYVTTVDIVPHRPPAAYRQETGSNLANLNGRNDNG
jgi:hypothetical protein